MFAGSARKHLYSKGEYAKLKRLRTRQCEKMVKKVTIEINSRRHAQIFNRKQKSFLKPFRVF